MIVTIPRPADRLQLSILPPQPAEASSPCMLCAPIASANVGGLIPSVKVFPMRKEKKLSRVEEEVVSVVEWQGVDDTRRWLFKKRPENGASSDLRSPLR